jgi:hypothetical protein
VSQVIVLIGDMPCAEAWNGVVCYNLALSVCRKTNNIAICVAAELKTETVTFSDLTDDYSRTRNRQKQSCMAPGDSSHFLSEAY